MIMSPMASCWWYLPWMGGGWIFPFLSLFVMLVVFFLCLRVLAGGTLRLPCSGAVDKRRESGESPLEIAKRRYAQGKITQKEFVEIEAVLQEGGTHEHRT